MKAEQILRSSSKFELTSDNPFNLIIKFEDKFARIRKQLNLNIITKHIFKNLLTSNSSSVIVSDLPKTHNADNSTRPILSTVNAFIYRLAKYFSAILELSTSSKLTLECFMVSSWK